MTSKIENASFAELKANRDEFIAITLCFTPDEVARRYVQARTDAKHRDERMAEMGKEITALQTECKRWNEQNSAQEQQLKALAAELSRANRMIEAMESRAERIPTTKE